jgi:transposase
MPAAYVKPYVKRGKSDALDAEGICEAVTCPILRSVVHQEPGAADGADAPPHP